MAKPFSLTLRLRSLGNTALATAGLAKWVLAPLSTDLRETSLGIVSGPAIQLSGSTVAESVSTNTVIGALSVINHPSGATGWTFAITSQSPASKLNISTANLRTNAALDYEANPTLSVTITASKASQTDIVRTFTINVTNVLEVTLGTLALSATTFNTGSATSGTITGATPGSTIVASGLPSGLTINGAARTWAWDGSGSVSTGSLTLTETHPDATLRATTIGYTSSTVSAALTISTAPTISGDPIVGQRLYATNGTYNAAPDSYTGQWYKDGVAISGETADNYLIQDADVGAVLAYKEIAAKSGYTSSALNASANTAAVANINLANAITAFPRTSSSGVTPMTYSIGLGSNVYSDYILWARVYSDAGLSTKTQDVSYTLTAADLEGTTDISAQLAAAGLTAIGATEWLRIGVAAHSPAGTAYSYVYPDAISPTDVVGGYRYAKLNVTALNGWFNMRLREIELAESIGGPNIATGKTYTYSNEDTGPVASDKLFDGNSVEMGVILDPAPFWAVIDFGVPVNPTQLRMTSHDAYDTAAPNTFTLALSSDGSTWETPVVNVSGVTWTGTETKTWNW